MRQTLFLNAVIVLSFIFATGIPGQSPKTILSQASKALGGKKKLKSIKSFEKRGLITRLKDGANGDFVMRAAKPDLYNSKFDLRGFESEVGFNGKAGWIRDSRKGLRTLTGEISDHFRAESSFRNWRWINYKNRKSKITDSGQTVINGRKVNFVVLTNPKAVSIRMYFDPTTNLLIREEFPLGNEIRTFDYSDYRTVNGVKEAFRIITRIDGEKFEIKLDQIVHNNQIDRSVFNFPRVLGKPLPDIPILLKQLHANEERVEAILENYSYSEKITKRKLDKAGILRVLRSETHQLSFYKGFRIRRLIAKNGKALTPKQQKNEDKEVEKRVRKIEKKIAKEEARKVSRSSTGRPDNDGRRISIAELLRASKLLNPRREILQGRQVIVFDFEPDPTFDFKNAKSFLKFFGKTAGVMWIDENDKQVARLEAILFNSYKIGGGLLAKLRKGASFTLEKKRLNDEIWLPSLADINLSVRVLLFGSVKVNQVIDSFDYRKFKTEVEGAKVNEIKNP